MVESPEALRRRVPVAPLLLPQRLLKRGFNLKTLVNRDVGLTFTGLGSAIGLVENLALH